jgi:hypothetical protein
VEARPHWGWSVVFQVAHRVARRRRSLRCVVWRPHNGGRTKAEVEKECEVWLLRKGCPSPRDQKEIGKKVCIFNQHWNRPH